MNFYRCGSAGGGKVKSDTFIGVNGTKDIEVGFRPKLIYIELNYDATAYPTGSINYDDGTVKGYMLTALNAGRVQPNTILDITVNDTGFSVKTTITTFVGKNCKYIAIG